jgi:hypothetical protein
MGIREPERSDSGARVSRMRTVMNEPEVSPQTHALRRSVEEARGVARRLRWILTGAFILLLIGIAALLGFKHVGTWWIFFQGIGGLAAGLGVALAARRARKATRALPDPEALAVLRSMSEEGDETTRQLAEKLMSGLHEEGTEVQPSAAPEGRGSELAADASRADERQRTGVLADTAALTEERPSVRTRAAPADS